MEWSEITTKRPIIEVFKQEYGSWMMMGNNPFIWEFIETKVPKHLLDSGTDEESEIFSSVYDSKENVTYCHVCLAKRIGDEVLLKGIDEFSGPYTHNKVPKSIKNRLSDLSSFKKIGYAKQFRERSF